MLLLERKLPYVPAVYYIGVGRFRILGGPRFRKLEGQGGAKFPAGTLDF